LALTEGSWDDGKLQSGALSCSDCSLTHRVEGGLPLLYIADERWEPCAREAQGWIELHKTLGIYDQTGVDIDFQLPYYPEEPWLGVARHFDAGLELAQLNGDETVLDLGAGRGWAAKHFALRGCRVAAIDIVADDQVGLGRAWALMADSGVSFAPVIGDFERLPFSDCTFDVVFCAAALHHAPDLTRMLRDVIRVLKPAAGWLPSTSRASGRRRVNRTSCYAMRLRSFHSESERRGPVCSVTGRASRMRGFEPSACFRSRPMRSTTRGSKPGPGRSSGGELDDVAPPSFPRAGIHDGTPCSTPCLPGRRTTC
jgi:SAM-dependent methyltransferase